MARVDLARRAKIGRDRRARTRSQILKAGTELLAEGNTLTAEAVAGAAGVAKGTFYYHFENVEEFVAEVSSQVERSLDEVLTPARTELRDPIARLSFTFVQTLEKAISDTGWARLVVRTSKSSNEFGGGVRNNLKADIAEAIAQGHVTVRDPELAADIFVGIWLQVIHGILERVAPPGLSSQALEAALRALGSATAERQAL